MLKTGVRKLPEETHEHAKIISLTADIVSAYVGNNPLPPAGLPDLIASIHSSLAGIRKPAEPETPKLEPAVNPRRSVFPDYIICLEDGKKFKSLRRHLDVHYGLTPEEYRGKWGLARDYPMVAPNYAATRSQLAKASGLGRKAAGKPVRKPAGRRS
ncbi:transcriptional regulator [Mesorhizobium sp. CU2]|uniref:MucR family transcriptional regulator n=1 Tax=unclassified Mesorhizobium TaxID=325217 RepID=UPI0011298E23|nr:MULTISPECIES: MucR family transcriptional regulator [unclassified Mesorhizobium]TPN86631.1 transcriptional regulator [Mesorhizobium sp. CU3]TPO20435.1 transcriptional regulator [Mesorhizobium sp. CU2]